MVAVALLSVIGCASDEIALVLTGPLDDLAKIPQDATAFAETGGPPILEVDEQWLKEFEDYWYGPWKQTEPKICTAQEFSWATELFPKQSIFGPNLLEFSASRVEAITANAQLDQYPSQATYGITVRNTSMRALPSADPFFYDFRKAGEGYPFDYNQNSAVWSGTPLFLSHISQDGRFIAAESPYTCGWIDSRDIATVDGEFVAKYRSTDLAAIRQDRIPISSGPDWIPVSRPDWHVVADDDKRRNRCPSVSSGGGCKPSCVDDTRSSVGPGRRSIPSSVL